MLSFQQICRIEQIVRPPRLERSLNAPLGPTTISARGVIGIAIGGSFLLLIVVFSTLIFHARRQGYHERQRITEEVLVAEEQMDFKTAVDLTFSPEITFARTLSRGPYQPRGGRIMYTDWDNIDPIVNPPLLAKTRKTMDQRMSFRMSGVRDSWPLAKIPLSLLPAPAPSTLTLNQVAPPGYVVAPESRWSRRNFPRNSRTKVEILSPESSFQGQIADPVTPTPRNRKLHQRSHSTSEAQLSTILRSTSQRLKRSSLTRTLTTFSRLPGSPPKERLPTPSRQANQSSEGIIENGFFESPESSMFDAYMQTPSSQKSDDEDFNAHSSKSEKLPAPSAISEECLCEVCTSEIILPGHLTSPSKQYNSGQMYQLHISTHTTNQPSLINKDSRASTTAFGKHLSTHAPQNIHSDKPYISLAGDPFYSQVRSSKPVYPRSNLSGPRPLYGREATFGQVGQEAIIKRPLSYTSPLQDVSGNTQNRQRLSDSHLSPMSNEEDRNSFRWSPQKVMRTRTRQLSPNRSNSMGKDHKRSNVVQMSDPTRSTSVIRVDPVMEESEDDLAELRFNVPPTPPLRTLRLVTPSKGLPFAEPERFISFPPPIVSPKFALTRPTSTIIVSPDRLAQSLPTLLAPPVLTMPIPLYLTGHCREPLQSSSPPRASVHSGLRLGIRPSLSLPAEYCDTSEIMRRRVQATDRTLKQMTSDLSNSPSFKERTTRRSQHHLSSGISAAKSWKSRSSLLGNRSVHRNSRPLGVSTKIDRRDSDNIYKERHRRRLAEAFSEADLQGVLEIVRPPTSILRSPSSVYGIKFPGVLGSFSKSTEFLSISTTVDPQLPPRNPKKWSNAMIKASVNAVRRESQIESPTPKSSPMVWQWETPDDFGLELPRKRATILTGDGTKFYDDIFRRSKKMSNSHLRNGGMVRPQSLGLYDEDGFLRSSPFMGLEAMK